jgi:hypothetical protein
MTKPILSILTGLLALALAIVWVSGHNAQAASSTVTGTASAIHVHAASTALVLRVSGNRLVDLTVPARAPVKSADGHTMSASTLQTGDRLAVSRNGAIEDLSQRLITVKGIVSVAPLGIGDPLVIQQSSSTFAILIDLSAKTRYSDASHETAKLEQLEDADQVEVRGLFDAVRGEMTRADAVTRLGPVHKKPSA